MHSPLVTIIIPLYNCENYIQETLESLLNQTYNRWESIIVDDGSKDHTQDLKCNLHQMSQVMKSSLNVRLHLRKEN